MDTDWSAEYAKAAEDADAQQSSKAPQDGVLAFVDLLLSREGGEWWAERRRHARRAAKSDQADALQDEDKTRLKELKKRLATVGAELMVEIPKLNASLSGKDAPREGKVRVLQLQVVCRMLRYGALQRKRKDERKALKKEIRRLLDRVALLLDAANPPSLADEDADERSPFQEFLQLQLAPRLQLLLPELLHYLLRTYELEEEEPKEIQDKDAGTAMLPPPPQTPVELPTSAATGKGSILSALRQEQPAKRAHPDATGLFKEVQLPPQMQRQQSVPRPRKSRRVSKSHSSASKGSNDKKRSNDKHGQDSLLRAAATGAKSAHKPRTLDFPGMSALEKARMASSVRKPGDSDLLRRAAVSASAKGPTAPLLHRAMSERSHFIGRQPGSRLSPGVAAQATTGRTQSPPAPGSALRRAVTASSVVMRTPDRPQKAAARTTRRVLVEASPPLRRPSGSGTSAPRLLQPKSSRGSTPPPLF
ncbi:unnamed protein product [Phytophthora fragariaefolia]|uniref:Unnamed protein product n=1 Tax=Phytophthora fragariaefolia TaxID=1490495 RepID=A0A9W6Y8X6_9STRA|nr:unnamed protein product [Phytophthora fragariaefolia]